MRIHIETESGQIVDLDVVSSDTVKDVKEQIYEKEGVEIAQ